jgi:hypothetical protein
MAFIKIIQPGSYNFGEPQVRLIEQRRGILVPSQCEFLVKTAGSGIVSHLKNLRFESGEVPVHLIAIGATEYYGPNRNGDGFSVDTCRRFHKTFEKFAKFYRNHKNDDPHISYGIVKLAYFNENMKRIELIVALNGTKEAARRNKGLVADKEIDDLKSGKDIAVSMACKVAYDVCSVCGNKARSRKEYCTGIDEGGKCPGGGLRNKIGTVLDDGTQLFAHNPEPVFFDISHVPRPADRIAWVTSVLPGYELPPDGEKRAGARVFLPGSLISEKENIGPSYEVIKSDHNLAKVKDLVELLSDIEQNLICKFAWPHTSKMVDIEAGIIKSGMANSSNNIQLGSIEDVFVNTWCHKIAVPLSALIAMSKMNVGTHEVKQAWQALPRVYSLITRDNSSIIKLAEEVARIRTKPPKENLSGLLFKQYNIWRVTDNYTPGAFIKLALHNNHVANDYNCNIIKRAVGMKSCPDLAIKYAAYQLQCISNEFANDEWVVPTREKQISIAKRLICRNLAESIIYG